MPKVEENFFNSIKEGEGRSYDFFKLGKVPVELINLKEACSKPAFRYARKAGYIPPDGEVPTDAIFNKIKPSILGKDDADELNTFLLRSVILLIESGLTIEQISRIDALLLYVEHAKEIFTVLDTLFAGYLDPTDIDFDTFGLTPKKIIECKFYYPERLNAYFDQVMRLAKEGSESGDLKRFAQAFAKLRMADLLHLRFQSHYPRLISSDEIVKTIFTKREVVCSQGFIDTFWRPVHPFLLTTQGLLSLLQYDCETVKVVMSFTNNKELDNKINSCSDNEFILNFPHGYYYDHLLKLVRMYSSSGDNEDEIMVDGVGSAAANTRPDCGDEEQPFTKRNPALPQAGFYRQPGNLDNSGAAAGGAEVDPSPLQLPTP